MLQTVYFIGFLNGKSVEILAATNLEFGGTGVLLNGDTLGIRAVGSEKECFEFEELLGHCLN